MSLAVEKGQPKTCAAMAVAMHLFSCLAQQAADAEYHIHWSRHLLACIREITGAQLHLGVRAVAYNPHFPLFASPFAGDRWLGAVH